MLGLKYKNAVYLELAKHIDGHGHGSDKRKTPRSRKPCKTDASTGHAFFFGDTVKDRVKYVTFDPDISTTRAVWNRMHNLGLHPCDESWNVFHSRVVKERDEKLSKESEHGVGTPS